MDIKRSSDDAQNYIEDHIVVIISKVLTRLLYVGYGIMVVILTIAIGGAVWVTRTQVLLETALVRLEGVEISIKALDKKFPPKWLMDQMDSMKEEDRRLQIQIDRLEGHDENVYTR